MNQFYMESVKEDPRTFYRNKSFVAEQFMSLVILGDVRRRTG